MSRLAGKRLIGLPPGQGGSETSIVSAPLRRHRVAPQWAHRVETVHAALALVLAGEGVALVLGCVAPLLPRQVLLKPLQRVR